MEQRKPKQVCTESAAALGKAEQESPAAAELETATARDLLETEEAADHSVPRKKKLAGEKRWSSLLNFLLVAFVMTVPPVVVVLGGRAATSAVWIAAARAQLRLGSVDGSSSYARNAPNKLLGGLLSDGFDERSCRSRYESSTYRRYPARQPSPHLVAKLRRHEELQQRCGPGTDSYDRAIRQLRTGKSSGAHAPGECKYVVSVSYRGLGNRILAAASTFLYAVLTDRVLLVDDEMGGLFCEPFPGTTWLLPRDFPLASTYANFTVDAAERYGNMRKNKVLATTTAARELPAFAYIYLEHDYSDDDKMFFCDDDQQLLSDVQWLVMRADTYVVPGLFLVTPFAEELDVLFPERDAVFHHLSRYLFHPTNRVWGLVSRYYRAYLARADQLVGIQVRAFERHHAKSPHILQQITSCVWKEKLLPEVLSAEDAAPVVPAPGARSKTVLMVSLRPWFFESIKSMYWEQATATGEDVSVHQPSHEEWQHFGEQSHDAKAWAEMYLLSLCDVLVTSGWSTFGYVAQGLAGVTPWVMYRPPFNLTAPVDPPCARDISMEPCFHSPPIYDCKLKQGADTGSTVPHLRHCVDVPWGLKLVDPKQ